MPRYGLRVCLLTLTGVLACGAAHADDLYLADGNAFPGQLWLSQGGVAERSIHRREAAPNPAFPRAVMKLGQVATGHDGGVFFASGLDGSVMHLLDARHEIQAFEVNGQVRDLACTGEGHTVYFSVVRTPQNGEPLADGKIYRRDLWNGQPTEIATVRQADVGGNWWGGFTIRGGVVYLATFEEQSRLFKLTSSGPQPVFPANTFKIQGLTTAPDGSFLFTTGADKVYRTSDFQDVSVALRGDRNFSDVSLRAAAEAPGP